MATAEAAAAKAWSERPEGYAIIKEAFESTSQNIKCAMAGGTLYESMSLDTDISLVVKADE
ncbi:hypothetical protein PHLCEN_2v9941 [Hermanssonia centrifuga]|uniref:Uncharacterized protein n=1 Tax=Hermanssonia centrifuga TaxID=98765 RepID=A0A2R6NPF3_9APHY|nr:hypothetical protein PHLCEN_2v9941 [Hermanssonia centrifuga]